MGGSKFLITLFSESYAFVKLSTTRPTSSFNLYVLVFPASFPTIQPVLRYPYPLISPHTRLEIAKQFELFVFLTSYGKFSCSPHGKGSMSEGWSSHAAERVTIGLTP